MMYDENSTSELLLFLSFIYKMVSLETFMMYDEIGIGELLLFPFLFIKNGEPPKNFEQNNNYSYVGVAQQYVFSSLLCR